MIRQKVKNCKTKAITSTYWYISNHIAENTDIRNKEYSFVRHATVHNSVYRKCITLVIL